MEYDFSMLRGRIVSKFKTLGAFAKIMGISLNSLIKKLSNESPWKHAEIGRAIELLEIKPDDVCTYFFTQRV